MAVRQYTAAQLLALRESPLVCKPDNLPAIEQWIEYVYMERADGVREKLRIPHSEPSSSAQAQQPKQQQRQQQRVSAGAEGSPMGSFSTGRPTLGTRSSTLRGNGEDISLGPPKTMFPSSRNVSRLSDLPDRTATTIGDGTTSEEPESARSRFFSDRQLNRRSMNNEKEGKDGRDNRDSWTSVRERREKQDREDGDRRNGFGERHDPRWTRDDRRNGDRAGGWREREQQRRDRDHDRVEKEPEWMDDPVVKKDQELGFGMARTQEEFQKWKEGMSKKAKGDVDKAEPVETVSEPAPPPPEPKANVPPLKLDGFESGMFGGWGAGSANTGSQGATTPGATGSIKASTGKPKTSRFASMFKPSAEETPPTPAAEEPSAQQPANGHAAKTTAEDQEGFNRVLQMLGSAKLGQPTPPQAEQTPVSPPPPIKTSGMNGGAAAKPKSRFTDMFAQKSPERLQSPQQGGVQLGDSVFGSESNGPAASFGDRMPERQVGEQQIPRSQAPQSAMSPEPSGIPFNALREQQPRPASGRINDLAMFDPPSRRTASPDLNVQNLIAQSRQRQHGSSESQQLLSLLRKEPSSSRPPSQQALPNYGAVDQMQHWLNSQQQPQMNAEPHAPKPRVPQQPPGLFEEQLMRNYPPEQQQRQEQPQMPPGMHEPQRRPSQRVPPGFYDEPSIFLQQQQQQQQQQQHPQQQQMRRQFADGPPLQQQVPGAGRRPSAHPNLPQMQIPQGQQFPPSEYHQLTSPVGAQGPPPPGFNPHMPRHPPGFHNINIFQQPQQREPPPPGFGGLQSPPANAPPGFFGPQGIPPGFPMQAQQMRSPTDGLPPGRGRGLWADQLCINQANIHERNR
ncbi:hypothetical protein M409DRAFT_69088 [Zasmidium cellare ATCC 36951]|uniref:Uncharacterized protein n=1 Tax=Zasmidium cellare ATCC 36951 TaxID=1080233 RepID=A0A6A6CAM5_ZASCE|nr:uncharacterized protein M409DRAFT_69088 [Zasmidium cellare ATCC 36951]KAF2162506.1 hypothetical protein M409DRAFT_69088 [Zasmidium cellare ATCC 36951]